MLIINNQRSLEEICKKLAHTRILSVDTEFLRRNTYFAHLSIVQIITDNHQIIIDILEVPDLTPLKNILLDNQILKILHAPKQDFEIFYRLFNELPQNIFDTQIAANICGLGSSLSYSELCKKICHITIDKTHQTANWLKRPISQDMLNYAIMDVKYLEPIYNHLYQIMLGKNLLNEYQTKINSLLDIKNYIINFQNAWQKIKVRDRSKNFIDKIQVLAAFREEYAKQNDLPRQHLITDKDLLKICNYLPTTNKELDSLNLSSKQITRAKYKSKLFELCQGLNEKEISQTI